MSCSCEKKKCRPKIIRGSASSFIVRLVKRRCPSSGVPEPFDLSTATEVKFGLNNEDGSISQVALSTGGLSVLNGPQGKCRVSLAPSGTSGLTLSDLDSLIFPDAEASFTIGGVTELINIDSCVDVQDPKVAGL